MTVEQAIDYIYASYMKAEPYMDYKAPDCQKRNPMYSKAVIEKRQKTPTVLVTGSKGKGSVSKMIAEILSIRHRVGLMTSPHIMKFQERFQIQGKIVSDENFVRAIEKIKPEFDKVEASLAPNQYISPMGIQAAAALEIFSEEKVTFQVMECGKGVAWDDVKNVKHKYAVVNRIFEEHTRELGPTLEDIARNKAAIISGREKAIFLSEQKETVSQIFKERAKQYKIPVRQYGEDFWCEKVSFTKQGMVFDVATKRHVYKELRLPLLGTYQAENCALAIAMCEEELGILPEAHLKQVLSEIEWPGRLELLCSDPVILLDACINKESCGNVLEALKTLGIEQAAVVIGIPVDKGYMGVAEGMKQVANVMIVTQSDNPHYKFSKEQVLRLNKEGIHATWSDSLEQAMEQAYQSNLPICILGTTSLISNVKELAARPNTRIRMK